MRVRRVFRIVGSLLLAALAAGPLRAKPDKIAPLDLKHSLAAALVARQLPHLHLNQAAFDDAVATNALHIFLTSLDFDHTYSDKRRERPRRRRPGDE